MLFELKEIIEQAKTNQEQSISNVLATVVDCEGASYREKGVCMLIDEYEGQTGAVSGGCVEQEIVRQSKSVFETGTSKIITYDGRYRLGCKGILYILIEKISISNLFYQDFIDTLNQQISVPISTNYMLLDQAQGDFHTRIKLSEKWYSLSKHSFTPRHDYLVFDRVEQPLTQLHIFGGEHDSVHLTKQASFLGWQVFLYTSPNSIKTASDFPGVYELDHVQPDQLEDLSRFTHKHIVLMTHNFARDLQFLSKLIDANPNYIGILGSADRREELIDELINRRELEPEQMDKIFAPAGADLGAETPQEIALSIVSELLAVERGKPIQSLRAKLGKIHS